LMCIVIAEFGYYMGVLDYRISLLHIVITWAFSLFVYCTNWYL